MSMTLWTVHTDTNKIIHIDANCAFIDRTGVLIFEERRWWQNHRIISFAPGVWRAFSPVGGYNYGEGANRAKFIDEKQIQGALTRQPAPR